MPNWELVYMSQRAYGILAGIIACVRLRLVLFQLAGIEVRREL